MSWRTKAACRNLKPEIFFDPETEDKAIAICQCCPVMQQCLTEALYGSEYGVRGGMTAKERERFHIPRMIGEIKVYLTEEDEEPTSIRIFKD